MQLLQSIVLPPLMGATELMGSSGEGLITDSLGRCASAPHGRMHGEPWQAAWSWLMLPLEPRDLRDTG